MYVPTGRDTYNTTSFLPENLFQNLARRTYVSRDWEFETYDVGDEDIDKKTAIAIGVSVGVGSLFLVAALSFIIICSVTRKRRKAMAKKKKEEREKRKHLLSVASSGGGDINEELVPNSVKIINANDEEMVHQDISRPSGAVLHSSSGLFSSISTKYEYEPLPPYEMTQS